ncbi:MAG: Ty1/Copia family ribonuclease HI, partial [Actinobacteria bacterium]|nr:Ty1/Copia family ribonuclease HI [Actinomycetota bacterium]
LGNTPVLWKSKRIQEICLSTMESEYISLSMAMRSLIYLRGLMFEIDEIFGLGVGNNISTISTVFEDNSAALALATTDPPRMTPRSKSLAVKYHWFRSHLSPSSIMIKSVASAHNAADIFTKALPFEAFARHRKTICGY